MINYNDVLVFNTPSQSSHSKVEFDLFSYFIKRCVALPGDTIEISNWHYMVRGREKMSLGNVKEQKNVASLFGDINMAQNFFDEAYPAYPKDNSFSWTIQNLGPLFIPIKNAKIELNVETMLLYRKYIEWETGLILSYDTIESKFFLGNDSIREYIFKKNYYFVAGDNIMDSRDSRYWGLVPEEFIVGVAVCVWKSSRGKAHFID